MRVLRVHNRYQERGGEDVCFDAEVDLLRSFGEDVRTLVVTNDEIPTERSLRTSATLAASTVWSRSGQQRIVEAIDEHDPEVVHFDNTFPLLSPAAYTACHRRGIPVVQTLHNYRTLCPSATFYRDDQPCEDCLGKTIPLPGIVHSCYRDSRAQTAAVAAMITMHNLRRTWSRDVDRYITMTRFGRDKFIEGGFPKDKITVKPHFVQPTLVSLETHREGLLFVGRLTPNKGIPMLVSAWKKNPSHPLTIAGTGPLASEVEHAAARHPNLHYVGSVPSHDVQKLMRKASLLVVPSQWYETFGLVAIESFAQGTPVLAPNHGAIGELVSPGLTGLHFTPGDTADLSERISWALDHPAELREMGAAAHREYEQKYTPERNYHMLMDIYREVIEASLQRTSRDRAHA